jgi:hypothetical protein
MFDDEYEELLLDGYEYQNTKTIASYKSSDDNASSRLISVIKGTFPSDRIHTSSMNIGQKLKRFNLVTGIPGSGKSTIVDDTFVSLDEFGKRVGDDWVVDKTKINPLLKYEGVFTGVFDIFKDSHVLYVFRDVHSIRNAYYARGQDPSNKFKDRFNHISLHEPTQYYVDLLVNGEFGFMTAVSKIPHKLEIYLNLDSDSPLSTVVGNVLN